MSGGHLKPMRRIYHEPAGLRVVDVEALRAEFGDEWPIFSRGGQSIRLGLELDPVDLGQLIDLQQREALKVVEAAVQMRTWWHESGRDRLDRILKEAR